VQVGEIKSRKTRASERHMRSTGIASVVTIEAWRNRPIEGEHPYVYLDGIVLKRSWAGEVRNVSPPTTLFFRRSPGGAFAPTTC
jgi:hypothetical protein